MPSDAVLNPYRSKRDYCSGCGAECETIREDVGPSSCDPRDEHDWRDLSDCCAEEIDRRYPDEPEEDADPIIVEMDGQKVIPF